MGVASFFRQHGYYVAKQLLLKPQVNHVLKKMQGLVRQELNQLGEPSCADISISGLFEDLQHLFRLDLARYIASLQLSAKLYDIHKLILSDEVADMAYKLGIKNPVFQTSPVLHLLSNELRIKDGYFGVGAHQDWTALQSGLNTLVLWVPLIDVDKEQHPIELIPGSHLKGLYPGHIEQNIYEIDSSKVPEEDFIPVPVEQGDVVFLSCFTVHRTRMDGDGARIAFSTRYEDAADPYFIEQGYTFAQKRVVKREFLVDRLPNHSEIVNTFLDKAR